MTACVTGADPRSPGQLTVKYSTFHSQYTNIMADNDNATRAPESDAQEKPVDPAVEQSVFPGDSRAQEGPTMGVSS
jgi:hypothetical protein